MKISVATANVIAARAMNTARQPTASTASSVGVVATRMPSAPNDMMAALASARRGSGTHSTTALKPLISPPAKPRPISARAEASVVMPWPSANSSDPAAAHASNAACTRRGPKRSSRRPSGSWNRANANR